MSVQSLRSKAQIQDLGSLPIAGVHLQGSFARMESHFTKQEYVRKAQATRQRTLVNNKNPDPRSRAKGHIPVFHFQNLFARLLLVLISKAHNSDHRTNAHSQGLSSQTRPKVLARPNGLDSGLWLFLKS